MKQEPFRIAIAGLGTVGTGVVQLLRANASIIAARSGRPIEIAALCDRDKNRDRGFVASDYNWVDDVRTLPEMEGLDAIVELIGGADGIAFDLAKATLGKWIALITANKAMLAHHGLELAELAEKKGARIGYEASVGGGIPIIKSLREGLAANNSLSIHGILNGTCNYILTQMQKTGGDFGDILKEAQKAGFAEADPSFDIDGIDTAHKLTILAALAFNTQPDFKSVPTKGIRDVTGTDIKAAESFGYRIKLLAVAQRGEDGKITRSVEPCLVPEGSALGGVEGSNNAIMIEGDFVQKVTTIGRGAGRNATASAVVADIIDMARGDKAMFKPIFGVPSRELAKSDWGDPKERKGQYYLRMKATEAFSGKLDPVANVDGFNCGITGEMKQSELPAGAFSMRVEPL
ncbi:MAG TPA: homoserine dehydrogenase [Rhodospirillaceae bacterium]|nr:homoserine dehydrogenase [Rhodospirillaceae bacterium]